MKGQTVQPESLPFGAGSVQPDPSLESSRAECLWLAWFVPLQREQQNKIDVVGLGFFTLGCKFSASSVPSVSLVRVRWAKLAGKGTRAKAVYNHLQRCSSTPWARQGKHPAAEDRCIFSQLKRSNSFNPQSPFFIYCYGDLSNLA